MKSYDAIILGAGIAGASTAYELSKRGQKVLVLENSFAGSGGSNAAGAFISPKISKPSPYKKYINDAFRYSTFLYKDKFNSYFNQCGLLKYPLDQQDIKRLRSYEEFIDVAYKKDGDNYFFKDAGILDVSIIKALLKNSSLKENYQYKNIFYNDEWHVDNFQAQNLIIATASLPKEFSQEYIKLKKISGYRYDVTFKDMDKLNHYLHKDVSISCFLKDHIIIGATHIKDTQNLENDVKIDKYDLIKKAKKFYELHNLSILKQYIGDRTSTNDYFPILGEVIDANSTIEAYPYITKGSKVPTCKYVKHENLYLHIALSSRGFVTAPYNAKLLSDLILDKKEIDARLSPTRLFRKWARRGDR